LNILIGATNSPSNLVFAASSTIEGAGTGQGITIGANSDVVNFGVNVGIGTTTPGSIFSINNVANLTAATSTFYSTGGINLTAGCFALNGTCITGSGGGGSSASSTLLTDTNTWSGNQTFNGGASITNLVVSGLGNGSTNCLQVNSLGQVSTTGSACGGSGSTPGGSNGQIQFNNSNSFGGASNLFWNSANNSLGVGTSSPYAELSIATPNGASGSLTTLFAIASSTSLGTTTLFSVDNKGNVISTLAASSTFAIGANGLTNPAFQVFASTTNAGNGLQLVAGTAGSGLVLNTLSSAAVDSLTFNGGKGTGVFTLNNVGGGAVSLSIAGTSKLNVQGTVTSFSEGNHSAAAGNDFLFNDNADPAITASTESLFNEFNVGAGTHKWINGNVALQRDFAILPGTHLMTSNNTASNFAALDTAYIGGAPLLGLWATSTNEYTLYLDASTLNASTTNSYGLTVNANTGAVNNYAAEFLGGNVGIGTTSPATLLEVGGSTANVTLDGYLSCTNGFVTNANGLVACGSSDQRLKQDITPLDASSTLAAINALTPVSFFWKPETDRGTQQQYGLIAQAVQQIFPNLVSTSSPTALTPDGTLTVNYNGLISPIIIAIQQLSKEIASIQNTIAGFAQSITSAVGNFGTVNTNQLCVNDSSGSTCITRSQLMALLSGQSSPSVQVSQTTTPVISTSTPPTINIQGDNPATIHIGDTYTDLGAIVTDNQGHSLSYTTYLNGVLVPTLTLDTSTTTTDTIDYVATDTWGNTSTSTRTVNIQ